MLSFETLLLQADVIESIGGLVVAAAALIGAVSAIVIAYINKTATGRKLTEQEKKILAGAEFTQLGAQKTTENIGEIKAIGSAIAKLGLTPEQKAIADKEIAPLIDQQTERIKVAQDQVDHFKKLLGVNVDANISIPRESPVTLRKINEDQR
jgi:hypothetical protein